MLKGLLKRMDRLQQKVAMITSGRRGLGETIAQAYTREASRRLLGRVGSIAARPARVVPAAITVRIDD